MAPFESATVAPSPIGAEYYTPEELIVGLASSFLSRGRFPGYALYFSETRIIGVKKRKIPLALLAVVEIPVIALLIFLHLQLAFSQSLFLLLLPLLPLIFDLLARRTAHYIPEKILGRWNPRTTGELGSRRDFELKREEIAEMLMKNVGSARLSRQTGYLKITPKNLERPITIKILRVEQFQQVRNLVIAFSSRPPKIRALEYP